MPYSENRKSGLDHTWKIVTIILSAVLGEIALIALTTVAQEVMFDGIDYYRSAPADLLFGGLATLIASALAGFIASVVVRGNSVIPHIIISILILLETLLLIGSGVLDGPLWFDLLSGLALIPGVWAGHLAARSFLYGS